MICRGPVALGMSRWAMVWLSTVQIGIMRLVWVRFGVGLSQTRVVWPGALVVESGGVGARCGLFCFGKGLSQAQVFGVVR